MITRLGRGTKGRPIEIDRGRDRLRPDGNDAHREIDLCPVGEKAVLLDKIASELGETIPLAVPVKDRPEKHPEVGTAVCRRAARPVVQADVHHAAQEQVIQIDVGVECGSHDD